MNMLFLKQLVNIIKTFFTKKISINKAYTTLKFANGTSQTKEINRKVTWKNIGVKTGEVNSDNTLTYCLLDTNVTEICGYTFFGCVSLSSIDIPNSVTTIGEAAFSFCSSLSSVNIPNSVTSIRDDSFRYCSSLTSITVDPNNPRYDSRDNCNAIIETNSNTLIQGCNNSTIPNSVTSIRGLAFSDCHSLTSISIPASVTEIGPYAFYYNDLLTSVIFEGKTSAEITAMENYPWSITDTSIIKPGIQEPIEQTFTTLKLNDGSIQTKEINGVATWQNIGIKSGETNSNSTLAYCLLGKNVTEISSYAFYNCNSLTSIDIPNSITSIGFNAFICCSSLSSINIPNSVISIGDGAFVRCSSLTSISIPASVTTIGKYAFSNCSSLASVNIPNSITSIGEYAFSWCLALTSIDIPSSVTIIKDYTFYGCSSLHSISISNSITSIGEAVFAYCSSLTSITIPNSVTSIGVDAFSNCSSLTLVIFEGKTYSEITAMANYPWEIPNTSAIKLGIS